jgi:hypothetical protein
MGGLLLSAVVGAIVGAIVTVYLQKRLTRDPAVEIAALRTQLQEHVDSLGKQVTAFQERVETLEHERTEAEQVSLSARLQEAIAVNYQMFVKNDSDQEVAIESVYLVRKTADGEVTLSPDGKPKNADDWKIPPHDARVLEWVAQRDPTTMLRHTDPGLRFGTPIPVQFVFACKIRNRRQLIRNTLLVTVDLANGRMTQVGP